jgi:VanZ family protein
MIKKNIFSIAIALIILYLSLVESSSLDKVQFLNIPHFDKIAHFLMYAGLMSVIILENRRSLNATKKIFIVALIPVLYGILMEILQLTITLTRSGSIYDALTNLAGVLTSVLLWLLVKPWVESKIK